MKKSNTSTIGQIWNFFTTLLKAYIFSLTLFHLFTCSSIECNEPPPEPSGTTTEAYHPKSMMLQGEVTFKVELPLLKFYWLRTPNGETLCVKVPLNAATPERAATVIVCTQEKCIFNLNDIWVPTVYVELDRLDKPGNPVKKLPPDRPAENFTLDNIETSSH